MKKIAKNITTEVVGSIVEKGFAAIATDAGFPAIVLGTPVAKGIILGLLENCYNDCAQRTLSIREEKKHSRVSEMALLTFRDLAEKDGVKAWELSIDPDYIDYAFEVADTQRWRLFDKANLQRSISLVNIMEKPFMKARQTGRICIR